MPDWCAPALIFAGGAVTALMLRPALGRLWMRLLEWAWRRER